MNIWYKEKIIEEGCYDLFFSILLPILVGLRLFVTRREIRIDRSMNLKT